MATAAVVVFAFAVALYSGTSLNGYCHDDHTLVTGNSHVRAPRIPLAEIFTSSYFAGAGRSDRSYRPLTILSYAVVERLGGGPFRQHAASVVVYGGVCVLLLVVTTRVLGLRTGAVTALLFAAHPVHTEAVAYVAGRGEVLALAFGLAAALAQMSGRPWLAASALLLALLSKETALSYPLLLAGATLASDRSRAHAAIPLLALGAYLLMRFPVAGGFDVAGSDPRTFITNPLAALDLGERALPALALQGRYLAKLLWPGRLVVDYSYAATDPAAVVSAGHVATALGAAGAAVLLTLRRRALGFVALAGLLSFVPMNNLVLPGGTAFADRLLFTPSAFFCVLAASAVVRLGGRRWFAIALALALALSVRTVVRVPDWRSDYTLFRSAYEDGSRDSVIVLHNYAFQLYSNPEHRDLSAAAGLLERAREIYPAFGEPEVTLAAIYLEQGRVAEASELIEVSLARYPLDYRSHRLKAELLLKGGAAEAARPYLERSLQLNPEQPGLAVRRLRPSPGR